MACALITHDTLAATVNKGTESNPPEYIALNYSLNSIMMRVVHTCKLHDMSKVLLVVVDEESKLRCLESKPTGLQICLQVAPLLFLPNMRALQLKSINIFKKQNL